MTSKVCLVCATDEGLFLDIFTHGKEFRDIIKKFLSLEIRKSKQSSRVCHKCAYELIECSKFVDKFNKVHQSETQKLRKSGYCGLCQEPGKKGYIYELRNDTLQNFFKQIHDIFHRDLSSTFKTLHVCLYCRYNLDVLSDLKKVAENHSTSDDTKIDVKVIKRKTTLPPSPQLHLNPSDTDTSVTPTMEKKSSRILSSPSNNRKCDKCELKIENKVGMYRSHHTGQTVCKDCWVIMDPHKLSTKRSKKNILESTKRCSVFLKDVLTDPPKNTSDSKKSKGPMRTEKDGHGNVVYVISDDSEMETSPKKGNSSKGTKRASSENDTKSTKRQKPSFEEIPRRETRASSVISTVSTASVSSKVLPKRRYSGTFEIPELEPKKLRPRGKKIIKDNETVKIEKIKEKPVRSMRLSRKQSPGEIKSSGDETTIKTRRNSKLSESHDKSYSPSSSRASSTSSRSRRENLADDEEKHDISETRKSKRVRNLKKNDVNDSKSQELSSDNGKNIKKTKKKIKKEKITSDDSKILDSPGASLSPIVRKETDDNEENKVEKDIKNEEKTESDGDNQAYTCTICSIEFETKVEGMTHELTHSKKLEVVLKKVSVSDADEEEEKKEEKGTSNEIAGDEKKEEKKIGEVAEVEDAGEKEAVPDNDEKEGEDEGKMEESAEGEEKDVETPEDNQKDAEKNAEVEVSQEINDEEKSQDVEKASEEENAAKCNEEPEEEASEESPFVDDKSKDKEEKEETRDNGEDSKEKEVLEVEEKEAEVRKDDEKEAEVRKDEEKEAEVREDEEIISENSEEAKLPEESSKDSEKPSELVEDDKHLTNGEKIGDSEKKEEEAVNSGETLEESAVVADEKVHEDEKKEDAHVSEDKPEENNENNEENMEDSGKYEGRESDEDSDEEKSPEPEPLSPVPLASPDDEDDDEMLPEEKKIEETLTQVVDKNNCNESDDLNKSAANSFDDSTEITNGEENKEAEDMDTSSESLKKIEDTDADDASMEALEKQMKTIVGSDEDKDKNVNNKNDSDDSKEITNVSALVSVNDENRDEA